jgi:cobalt-zinc-cadmium efflux system outer membrane protein
VLAALAAGCARDPWVRALDEAPGDGAALEKDAPPRTALEPEAAGAPRSLGKPLDPNPTDLAPASEADREHETAEILKRERFRLGDAVRLAELNSRDLVASYEAIVASHGALLAAAAYPNPSFAFATGPIEPKGQFSQDDGGLPHPVPLFTQASYSLTFPVVTGLRLLWAKREAVAQEWAARATWQALYRTDVQAVEAAYVNVLFANENLKLQQELLDLAEELDRIAQRQLDAGVIAAGDKLQADVALAQARAAAEVARQAIVGAEASLGGLIGGVSFPAARVGDALVGSVTLAAEAVLEDEMVRTHPALRSSELAVSAARADTRLQRAQLVPDVGLSVGYERDYLDSPPNRGFDVLNFGVSFTFPFWYWNEGQIMTSDANLRAAEANLAFATTGLRASLRATYSNVLAQRRQVDELREHVIPLAERALDFVTKSFAAGSSRIIDVLNARQNLASSRQSLLAALQSLDTSLAGLEALTGQRLLVPE